MFRIWIWNIFPFFPKYWTIGRISVFGFFSPSLAVPRHNWNPLCGLSTIASYRLIASNIEGESQLSAPWYPNGSPGGSYGWQAIRTSYSAATGITLWRNWVIRSQYSSDV